MDFGVTCLLNILKSILLRGRDIDDILYITMNLSNVVLVCFSIAEDGHHDHSKSYERKCLTGPGLHFQGFNPFSSG